MRAFVLVLAAVFSGHAVFAQNNTFRLDVLAYQWTTTHRVMTFTWPGRADTSCNGNIDVSGYISGGGNFSASGTSSNTCSTTYTPPSNQNIDIQKPVVFILADSESSRMVLTCTRNVLWSQCHALIPGTFLARFEQGHFEVKAKSDKDKEEWVKFDVVQQAAIVRQHPPTPPVQEVQSSIDAPKSETENLNSGYPSRWKSMASGSIRALRVEGQYIYAEAVLSEAAAKAGAFNLMDVKKDGDKFIGKMNARFVAPDGSKFCTESWPVELTLVTRDRIEGRAFTTPLNAQVDWNSCTYSLPAAWQDFTWIPVK